MENIATLAAPRSFRVPKKKSRVETAPKVDVEPECSLTWETVTPNSEAWTAVEKVLRDERHLYEKNLKMRFENMKLIKNPYLEYRFEKYRQTLKANYADTSTFAFMQLGFQDEEAEHIGTNGVPIGMSYNNDIGDPSQGVYLYSKVDLMSPQTFFVDKYDARRSPPVRVLVCKVLKGKPMQVGLGSHELPPTTNYGCHVPVNRGMQSGNPHDPSKKMRLDSYRQNALYIYELDDSMDPVIVPSGVLPYAIVDIVAIYDKDSRDHRDRKLRLPSYQLSHPLYTAEMQIAGGKYPVNLLSMSEDTWKILGVDPGLSFNHCVSWSSLCDTTPFKYLFTEKLFDLTKQKEFELPDNTMVGYMLLQGANRSDPGFAKLCDSLRCAQQACVGDTPENVRLTLLPSSEVSSRLGLPWPREPSLHLVVHHKYRGPQFGDWQESVFPMFAKGDYYRQPNRADHIIGNHTVLVDLCTEEFDHYVTERNGRGVNLTWKKLHPDQRPPAVLAKVDKYDGDYFATVTSVPETKASGQGARQAPVQRSAPAASDPDTSQQSIGEDDMDIEDSIEEEEAVTEVVDLQQPVYNGPMEGRAPRQQQFDPRQPQDPRDPRLRGPPASPPQPQQQQQPQVAEDPRRTVRFNEKVDFSKTPPSRPAPSYVRRDAEIPLPPARPPGPGLLRKSGDDAKPGAADRKSSNEAKRIDFGSIMNQLKSGGGDVHLAPLDLPGMKSSGSVNSNNEPISVPPPPASAVEQTTLVNAPKQKKKLTQMPLPNFAKDPLLLVESSSLTDSDSGVSDEEGDQNEHSDAVKIQKDEYDPANVDFDSDEEEEQNAFMDEIGDAPSPDPSDDGMMIDVPDEEEDSDEEGVRNKGPDAQHSATESAKTAEAAGTANDEAKNGSTSSTLLVMNNLFASRNASNDKDKGNDSSKTTPAPLDLHKFLSAFTTIAAPPKPVEEPTKAPLTGQTGDGGKKIKTEIVVDEQDAPMSPTMDDDVPASPTREEDSQSAPTKFIPLDGADADYRFPSTAAASARRRTRYDNAIPLSSIKQEVVMEKPFGSSADVDLRLPSTPSRPSTIPIPTSPTVVRDTDLVAEGKQKADELLRKLNPHAFNLSGPNALSDMQRIVQNKIKGEQTTAAAAGTVNGNGKIVLQTPSAEDSMRYTQGILQTLVRNLNLTPGVVHNARASKPTPLMSVDLNKPEQQHENQSAHLLDAPASPSPPPMADHPSSPFGHREIRGAFDPPRPTRMIPDTPFAAANVWESGVYPDNAYGQYAQPGNHHPVPAPTNYSPLGSHAFGAKPAGYPSLGEQACAQAYAAHPGFDRNNYQSGSAVQQDDSDANQQLNRKLRRKLAKGETVPTKQPHSVFGDHPSGPNDSRGSGDFDERETKATAREFRTAEEVWGQAVQARKVERGRGTESTEGRESADTPASPTKQPPVHIKQEVTDMTLKPLKRVKVEDLEEGEISDAEEDVPTALPQVKAEVVSSSESVARGGETRQMDMDERSPVHRAAMVGGPPQGGPRFGLSPYGMPPGGGLPGGMMGGGGFASGGALARGRGGGGPGQPLIPFGGFGGPAAARFQPGMPMHSMMQGRMPMMNVPRPELQQQPEITIVVPDSMLFNCINFKALLLEHLLEKMSTAIMMGSRMQMQVHRYVVQLCETKSADLHNDPRGSEYQMYVTILNTYQDNKGVVKMLASHACDTAPQRTVDVITTCLKVIRDHQQCFTRVIYMSNMSPHSESGRRILTDGFDLRSPAQLAQEFGVDLTRAGVR